jgi:hypothetical protein
MANRQGADRMLAGSLGLVLVPGFAFRATVQDAGAEESQPVRQVEVTDDLKRDTHGLQAVVEPDGTLSVDLQGG